MRTTICIPRKDWKKIIRMHADKSPKEIVMHIYQDVIDFSTSESKYQDDKTLVVIKKKETDES